MLRTQIKHEVSFHVNLSKHFLCTTYSWERSSKSPQSKFGVKISDSSARRKLVYFLLFLTAFYSLIMVFQAIIVQQSGYLSTTKIILGCGFPVFFVAGTIYRINFIQYEHQGAELLNNLLNFEIFYPNGEWKGLHVLNPFQIKYSHSFELFLQFKGNGQDSPFF